ncbi:hypothetical protein ACPA9J_05420 [Pseudomonas aeruginosa]
MRTSSGGAPWLTATERLQPTWALASRHIFMLSLGGVIGTGLFMGLRRDHQPGRPGRRAVLAYLVAGVLMYLVMVLPRRAVGADAGLRFVPGPARRAFIWPGDWLAIGWVYWMSWASTVGLEFTAAGMLTDPLVPGGAQAKWSKFPSVSPAPSMPGDQLRRGRVPVCRDQGGGDPGVHRGRGW